MSPSDPQSRPRKKPPPSLWEDALNLPNALTLARIAAIPLVLWLLADGTRRASFWAAIVYVLSAVTDALDGWLARRRKLVSLVGKFLDPLADKLLVMATLVFMVHMGRLPLLGTVAVVVIVARELSVTSLRAVAMSEGVVIAAGQGGKDKTALQMLAILLLMLHYPYELDFFVARVRVDMNAAGLVLLYLSVVWALLSAGEYVQLLVRAIEAKRARLGAALQRNDGTSSPERVAAQAGAQEASGPDGERAPEERARAREGARGSSGGERAGT